MPLEVVERQARLLAKDNREADPEITDIYWFPNADEVRLVEVLPSIPSTGDGQIHPYFFRPSPQDDLPAPSGVALIRPDEVRQSQLPPTWGTWDEAIELERES